MTNISVGNTTSNGRGGGGWKPEIGGDAIVGKLPISEAGDKPEELSYDVYRSICPCYAIHAWKGQKPGWWEADVISGTPFKKLKVDVVVLERAAELLAVILG